MPLFFIALLSAYLIGNIYIFIRGAQAVSTFPWSIKILLTLLYWCTALSFIGSFLLRNIKLPFILSHTFHEIGTGWLVFTLYMVLCLLFFDLLRLFNTPFKQGFTLSILLTISLLGDGYYNFKNPQTKVINITINKTLPTYTQPIKVVAVSDVHLGHGTGKKQLKQYVDHINNLHPDLILVAGDLIDNSVVPLYEQQMQEELSQLQAPLGIYMVPGNHEFISGIEKCIPFLEQTPIRLLRDTVITLPNGLQLIGRDDRSNRSRLPLQTLLQQTDPNKPILLLDHQPFHLNETEKAGVDFQFSGHTHHGQIWPITLVTDHLFEQSYGYRQWGDSHIYVSSGLSLWGPPFRIGTDSEFVIIQITCKK
ncbi:MAG: metallophosphoesterase [Parabacteroides distasonis]|nr:metallophosphoesterase [Parabacteroides distasonis]